MKLLDKICEELGVEVGEEWLMSMVQVRMNMVSLQIMSVINIIA